MVSGAFYWFTGYEFDARPMGYTIGTIVRNISDYVCFEIHWKECVVGQSMLPIHYN